MYNVQYDVYKGIFYGENIVTDWPIDADLSLKSFLKMHSAAIKALSRLIWQQAEWCEYDGVGSVGWVYNLPW